MIIIIIFISTVVNIWDLVILDCVFSWLSTQYLCQAKNGNLLCLQVEFRKRNGRSEFFVIIFKKTKKQKKQKKPRSAV